MKARGLTIFVEGGDDRRFIESVVVPKLRHRVAKPTVVTEYVERIPKQINKLVQALKSVGEDYIFMGDIDKFRCYPAKRNAILRKYPDTDSSRVHVVVREIEGWYYAGLDTVACKELRLRAGRLANGTDHLSKELVADLRSPNCSTTDSELLIRALRKFNWNLAVSRNSSLRAFESRFLRSKRLGNSGARRLVRNS